MAYRTYLLVIPKEDYKRLITCKTEKEIATISNCLEEYRKDNTLFQSDWLHKYIFDEIDDMANKLNKNRFFKDKSFNKSFNTDCALFKIKEKDLLILIEEYHKAIYENYESKMNEFRIVKETEGIEFAFGDMMKYLMIKSSKWRKARFLRKDKNISKLADSYNLEEGIYNLLHLYKTFDSRKNILVVCGW